MCKETVTEELLVPMSDKEIEKMLNMAKDDMEWTELAKHLDEAGIKKQAKQKDDIIEVSKTLVKPFQSGKAIPIYNLVRRIRRFHF